MTLSPWQGRRWRNRVVPVIGAGLALAMLLPVTVLFVEHWRNLDAQRAFATQEQRGLSYLAALNRVTLALTDAQSAAVAGAPASPEALAEAIAATHELDDQIGDELRVQERWAELRRRIEQLGRTAHPDPRAAYSGYAEATSLLLDLHTKLRETSGIIQDPDTDVYYLQDAAAEELPEAIIAAGRLADLVSIAAAAPADAQDSDNAEISVARAELASPVGDLAVDLQAALDSTESRTLSSNVLSKLDHLLRQKDALLTAIPPDGRVVAVDVAEVTEIRDQLHAAGSELMDALLAELELLIQSRLDGLVGKQRTAIAAAAVALLLVAGVLWVVLTGARVPRHRRRAADSGPPGAASGRPAPPEQPANYPRPERAGAR